MDRAPRLFTVSYLESPLKLSAAAGAYLGAE
jgi:hypothetical protein